MAGWGRGRLVAVGLIAVAVGAGVWWITGGEPIPTKPPANAPKVGDCWSVQPAAAVKAMPWPGSAVACTSAHTTEVFYVGQADHDLISRARAAKGEDAKVATNLMYAQVRRGHRTVPSPPPRRNWHHPHARPLPTPSAPAPAGRF